MQYQWRAIITIDMSLLDLVGSMDAPNGLSIHRN